MLRFRLPVLVVTAMVAAALLAMPAGAAPANVDVTCLAVSFMSASKLYERLCVPFRVRGLLPG